MKNNEISVLLIDDDHADRELIRRSFRKHKIDNPIATARDGVEGLAMLRGQSDTNLQGPIVVLLDLNMPRMDGIAFLDELRADPELKSTVVFVLTTSDDDRDKDAAYERNVAGYMVKSTAGEDFLNLISLLDVYGKYVEFPR